MGEWRRGLGYGERREAAAAGGRGLSRSASPVAAKEPAGPLLLKNRSSSRSQILNREDRQRRNASSKPQYIPDTSYVSFLFTE